MVKQETEAIRKIPIAMELVSYGGDFCFQKKIPTGEDAHVVAIPTKPSIYNLAVGHIHDTWNRFTPLPTIPMGEYILSGKMHINRIEYAWVGAVFQVLDKMDYYEYDSIFVEMSRLENLTENFYHQLYTVDTRRVGEVFAFKHSSKELLKRNVHGDITFACVGGDIRYPGVIDIEVFDLRLEQRNG